MADMPAVGDISASVTSLPLSPALFPILSPAFYALLTVVVVTSMPHLVFFPSPLLPLPLRRHAVGLLGLGSVS